MLIQNLEYGAVEIIEGRWAGPLVLLKSQEGMYLS